MDPSLIWAIKNLGKGDPSLIWTPKSPGYGPLFDIDTQKLRQNEPSLLQTPKNLDKMDSTLIWTHKFRQNGPDIMDYIWVIYHYIRGYPIKFINGCCFSSYYFKKYF